MQTTTTFRQVRPGLYRVHPGIGNDTYILPGFYLQDCEHLLEPCTGPKVPARGSGSIKHLITDVRLKTPTRHFPHIAVLLKLRWLLRLHSAGCELDYKMCSMRGLFLGMQFVVLQQSAEAETDNIFDAKVKQGVGQFLNLESLIDDIVDQLDRALGVAWRPFLEFVATCDTTRAVHISKMDAPSLSSPQVHANDHLAVVLDTVFLANFLRTPRKDQNVKLQDLYDDLEAMGIPLPEVPPLRGAQHLRAMLKAKTKPTRVDREKGLSQDQEKLSQLDAVLLCAAIELHSPEVAASPAETNDNIVNNATTSGFPDHGAPEPVDFGSTGRMPGSAGPSAARKLVKQKPQLAPWIVDAAVLTIHSHQTFPEGIRERLYNLLLEEYGLTEDQTQRLAIAVTQDIDGKRLDDQTLWHMHHKEKTRLKEYAVRTYKDTSHLIAPPLVPGLSMQGKAAKYTESPPPPYRPPFASAFTSMDMTRSLPDFRSFTVKSDGREPFKVPLSTGPLTMDPDLRKLRTTGYFIKMPPLKGQS